MYERPEPTPEDHARLARLCGAPNPAFKNALQGLIEEGEIIRTEDGLCNDRVEKEQVYLSEKSEGGLRAAMQANARSQNSRAIGVPSETKEIAQKLRCRA